MNPVSYKNKHSRFVIVIKNMYCHGAICFFCLPHTCKPGERQYCAFLLLKALQTVARAYEAERGLRATRAGQMRRNLCGLHSLNVSLEKYFVGPNAATINNCQGVCDLSPGNSLPNVNNHAILLHKQIEHGMELERPLCCVPVAYEDLEVVEWNSDGTYICIKPNMVAKECGCR